MPWGGGYDSDSFDFDGGGDFEDRRSQRQFYAVKRSMEDRKAREKQKEREAKKAYKYVKGGPLPENLSWLTCDQLRQELRKLHLDDQGNKPDLIARLTTSVDDNGGPKNDELLRLTCQQLKDRLRERSLTVSGVKADLVKRLQVAMQEEGETLEQPPCPLGDLPRGSGGARVKGVTVMGRVKTKTGLRSWSSAQTGEGVYFWAELNDGSMREHTQLVFFRDTAREWVGRLRCGVWYKFQDVTVKPRGRHMTHKPEVRSDLEIILDRTAKITQVPD
eukprot:Hpha_TRINITY_DN15673_c5_g1::TRINITY_DN15673_c5_g1_i1::g.98006::m.98006